MRRFAIAALLVVLAAAGCASDPEAVVTTERDRSIFDAFGNPVTNTTSTTIDCDDHADHDELHHRDCIDAGPDHADPPTPMPGDDDHHHAECATPASDEEQAAADALIAAVEQESSRFATEQQARDAGYVVIAPPFAGHGAHWVNPALFDDGAIVDPTKPESLIYLNGQLEGFMFLMDETDDVGPQPGGCLTQWHSHDDLCMTGPIQEGGSVVWLTDFGPCPQGSEVIIPPPMLHVWTIENPEGPFAGLET